MTIHKPEGDSNRRVQSAMETVSMRHRGQGPSSGSPLAGPIYTAPHQPESCGTCNRKGAFMRSFMAGLIECSHVDCHHRNRVTAQPRDQAS